jgi:2-dehydropantoate 2-reductase
MRFHVVSNLLVEVGAAISNHQLGIGSIGTLISHQLRQTNPDAPISLIVRKARNFPSTRQYPTGKYLDQAISLSVTRNSQSTTTTNFDQETYNTKTSIRPPTDDPDGHYGPIKSLIVCLKTPTTVQALSLLKHRISPNSVIALLQNGMGVYDELCSQIWPEPATRPFFILGTTTHGVTATERRGDVIHMSKVGEGDIKWGLVPDPRKEVDLEQWVYGSKVSASILSPPETPSLPLPPLPSTQTDLAPLRQTVSALLSLTSLDSTLLPIAHLHHTLLLKVALNANINPLTAIIGSGSLPNGSLIGSSPSHRLIRMISDETSSIIMAYLDNLYAPNPPPPDAQRLYTREAIITRTLALCHATSGNTSSMAADTKNARMTEIDHINGYLIQLADRLKVPAPHHKMLREMVKFTTEVTGLRKETSLGTRTRVNRRTMEIDNKVKDVQTQRLLFDTAREERQARQEVTRSRKERRTGITAKRRQVREAELDSGNVLDPGLVKADKNVKRTRQKFGLKTVDQDMLAHLDELAESVRSTGDEPTVEKKHETAKEAEAVEDSTPKETEALSEEEEAIKALETRILGGSRFGKRRF